MRCRRPIVTIFGTVITYTIGYRKIVSLFHLTYFVQLPYLGKLLNLKIRRFSLKQLFVILIKTELYSPKMVIQIQQKINIYI